MKKRINNFLNDLLKSKKNTEKKTKLNSYLKTYQYLIGTKLNSIDRILFYNIHTIFIGKYISKYLASKGVSGINIYKREFLKAFENYELYHLQEPIVTGVGIGIVVNTKEESLRRNRYYRHLHKKYLYDKNHLDRLATEYAEENSKLVSSLYSNKLGGKILDMDPAYINEVLIYNNIYNIDLLKNTIQLKYL